MAIWGPDRGTEARLFAAGVAVRIVALFVLGGAPEAFAAFDFIRRERLEALMAIPAAHGAAALGGRIRRASPAPDPK